MGEPVIATAFSHLRVDIIISTAAIPGRKWPGDAKFNQGVSLVVD